MNNAGISQVRNFVALTERIGTAGQPERDQLAAIADAGYRVLVNLAMPDHAEAIPDEGARAAALGMCYLHIPVPWDAPEPRHVLSFCRAMTAFRDEPVFVHCVMNYRVSVFCYHYLTKVEGVAPEAARSPIFDRWTPDGVWREVLEWSEERVGLP